jgi:hypothetical protein
LKEVLYKEDLEKLIGKRPFDENQVFDETSLNGNAPNANIVSTIENTDSLLPYLFNSLFYERKCS